MAVGVRPGSPHVLHTIRTGGRWVRVLGDARHALRREAISGIDGRFGSVGWSVSACQGYCLSTQAGKHGTLAGRQAGRHALELGAEGGEALGEEVEVQHRGRPQVRLQQVAWGHQWGLNQWGAAEG